MNAAVTPCSIEVHVDGGPGVLIGLTSAWSFLDEPAAAPDVLAAAIYEAALRSDAAVADERFADTDPLERLEWELSTLATVAAQVELVKSSAPAGSLIAVTVHSEGAAVAATGVVMACWLSPVPEASSAELARTFVDEFDDSTATLVAAEDIVNADALTTLVAVRLGADDAVYGAAMCRLGDTVMLTSVALGRGPQADVVVEVLRGVAETVELAPNSEMGSEE